MGKPARAFKGAAGHAAAGAAALGSPAMTDQVLLCYCTYPDSPQSEHFARTLVEEGLATCINRLPGVRSTYRWEGQVSTDSEELLLIKTTAARFEALKARLLELHPYELPELIAVPVEHGHAAYLDWVRAGVAG